MPAPRRSRHLIWLLALGAALAALAYLRAAAGPGPPAPAAVGAGGAITVFFTTPELAYPDVPRDRRAPAAERALVADIDAARSSVELASFEYSLSSVAEALARARARGVTVRLALDREPLLNPVMAKWAGVVEGAGIPVSWEESEAFLHSKFVIVDRRLVWTGSWNPTINDTYRNNNNLLRITAPALVANYAAEFERMAGGAFGTAKAGPAPNPVVSLGGAMVANAFSPHEAVRPQIVALIGQARAGIEVLAFSFTDDAIAGALLERQAAGVPVRAVFEARNVQGSGSEYGRLRQGGVTALEDGNCYTMHHKVIIIDRRVVITGSYNFTARAEDLNDENALLIEDPALAAAYLAEFERVYAQARSPLRCVE